MSERNEREVRDRLWAARIIRGALHLTRDAEMVAAVTAAIVKTCEGGSLERLDAVLFEAIGLLSGPRLGALKKACDGVIARTSGPKVAEKKARPSAKKSGHTPDTASGALFEVAAQASPAGGFELPEGELVFVDTETTGLKAGAHQVIEIGAMTSEGAEFVACVKLWPGAEVDPGAMRINGIDLRGRQWRTEAVALDEALRAFVRWLPTGAVLVAHNAAFDRRMLEGDAARVGVEWPSVEWFCTKQWADDLRKRGVLATLDSKLHTLCERFGVPNDGEHRALADVVRMARVYEAMAELEETRRAA